MSMSMNENTIMKMIAENAKKDPKAYGNCLSNVIKTAETTDPDPNRYEYGQGNPIIRYASDKYGKDIPQAEDIGMIVSWMVKNRENMGLELLQKYALELKEYGGSASVTDTANTH